MRPARPAMCAFAAIASVLTVAPAVAFPVAILTQDLATRFELILPAAAPPTPTAAPPHPVATPATPAISAISASDAEAFATILAAQSQAEPLAGPFTANLTEEDGRVALSWADVDVADFHARATFAVPEDASDIPWSIGFMFRASPAGTLRIAVGSSGAWYASVGAASPFASGAITGLMSGPGATNTLDLIVANERAVLGVNGHFAAVIVLPRDGIAADVAVGAAYFTEHTFPDRKIPFREFVVLPFDPDAVSIAEPSASGTPASRSEATRT